MALDVQMETTIKLMTRDDCQITAPKWSLHYKPLHCFLLHSRTAGPPGESSHTHPCTQPSRPARAHGRSPRRPYRRLKLLSRQTVKNKDNICMNFLSPPNCIFLIINILHHHNEGVNQQMLEGLKKVFMEISLLSYKEIMFFGIYSIFSYFDTFL